MSHRSFGAGHSMSSMQRSPQGNTNVYHNNYYGGYGGVGVGGFGVGVTTGLLLGAPLYNTYPYYYSHGYYYDPYNPPY
jgi:hypothetical protein